MAITTGFGNASVSTTTRNALYIKGLFNLNAAVYAGASMPIGNSLGEGYRTSFTEKWPWRYTSDDSGLEIEELKQPRLSLSLLKLTPRAFHRRCRSLDKFSFGA